MSDTPTTKQEAWQKARSRLEELRASGWKPVHLDPIAAAKAKPTSLRLAIRAHCYQCVGTDVDPGYKARVRDCGILSCSLHPHRPWQAHKGAVLINEEGIVHEEDGTDAPGSTPE